MPVTPDGFVVENTDAIKAEIDDSQRNALGDPSLNTSSSSVLGQLNGIIADKLAELNEVLLDLSNSVNPETATGAALDALCALTGVVRLPAAYSTVTLRVNLNAGTSLTAGRIVSASGNPNVKFTTLAAVTNGGGAPANFDVLAAATVTGPVFAAAGALTVIETPVSGWNSVTNLLDVTMGRNIETDAALRARRDATLAAAGSANAEAIRADILSVAGVTQAAVFENYTDVTDPDGVPPHAFEAVVQGGANADIAQAIWDSKPIGIATHGGVTQAITDYSGTSQNVKFSRPTTVAIYVAVTLKKDPVTYAGDAAVKTAIATAFAPFLLGQDVIASQLYAAVFAVAGVKDVVDIFIGTAPAPVSDATLVITSRQLATNQTTDVSVTASDI